MSKNITQVASILIPTPPSAESLSWVEPMHNVRHTVGGDLSSWFAECAEIADREFKKSRRRGKTITTAYVDSPCSEYLERNDEHLLAAKIGEAVAVMCGESYLRADLQLVHATANQPLRNSIWPHRDGEPQFTYDTATATKFATIATLHSTIAVRPEDVVEVPYPMDNERPRRALIPGRSAIITPPCELIVITEDAMPSDPFHCSPFASPTTPNNEVRFFHRTVFKR